MTDRYKIWLKRLKGKEHMGARILEGVKLWTELYLLEIWFNDEL